MDAADDLRDGLGEVVERAAAHVDLRALALAREALLVEEARDLARRPRRRRPRRAAGGAGRGSAPRRGPTAAARCSPSGSSASEPVRIVASSRCSSPPGAAARRDAAGRASADGPACRSAPGRESRKPASPRTPRCQRTVFSWSSSRWPSSLHVEPVGRAAQLVDDADAVLVGEGAAERSALVSFLHEGHAVKPGCPSANLLICDGFCSHYFIVNTRNRRNSGGNPASTQLHRYHAAPEPDTRHDWSRSSRSCSGSPSPIVARHRPLGRRLRPEAEGRRAQRCDGRGRRGVDGRHARHGDAAAAGRSATPSYAGARARERRRARRRAHAVSRRAPALPRPGPVVVVHLTLKDVVHGSRPASGTTPGPSPAARPVP